MYQLLEGKKPYMCPSFWVSTSISTGVGVTVVCAQCTVITEQSFANSIVKLHCIFRADISVTLVNYLFLPFVFGISIHFYFISPNQFEIV